MRRPTDLSLRAGLYVAAALSGLAAAYVLKGWVRHLWDAQNPPCVFPDSPDDKPTCSSPQQDSRPTDDVPAPVTDPEHTSVPSLNADPPSPSTNQTKSLPPLRTHSLPPPLPNGRALLAQSSFSISVDDITSPTFTGSFHTSSSEDGIEEEHASQTDTSDTESFVDVLSPPPTHVISRRRSMRAHDLFAAEHISFSELGSLVAPQSEPQ